ncbi:cell division protein ZapA [Saccharophagus degradans]|uniref:Cell division protein ZapA n=1 Tax=Saccharophagus degradans (strain 2-40 / ATCC 43961 / DSM 17024) TaxID=203122 RepID=Q21EV8_SACD2|nr:cell division protein ZapA [Saccharophagus degradans]ABD82771.1 cell division protein ZapA [Saccharophagus degradans 2-40]
MTDSNRVYVNILDKDYQIACPAEERDALHRAAEELDERMRAIRNTGSIIGLERIAVMAALNLCHELQQQRKNTAKPNDAESISRMMQKIDKVLTSHE